MFKGLKYCVLALILLVVIIFFVIKSVSDDNRATSLLNRALNRKPKTSPIVYKEEKTIKIVEGWRNGEIIRLLEENNLTSEEDFIKAQEEYDLSKFSFLADKPKGVDLEGYLYPDTYRVFASTTATEIIDRMLSNLDKKLTAKMREDIKAQGKTIYQILTMASLIEKEAPISYSKGDNSDAKIISGIFWNRIKSGQALQSCATLAYILGVNKAQYSEADTRVQSPYNTYQNPGLPPGPISNPGILAIEAAIYPTSTNYNYFLTPLGSKDIIYSSTYQEHLRNKNKYLNN